MSRGFGKIQTTVLEILVHQKGNVVSLVEVQKLAHAILHPNCEKEKLSVVSSVCKSFMGCI